MAKAIIVYATRDGHSKALAQGLAAKTGSTATEIVDLVNRKGLWGFIKSGAQASMKLATPIKDPGLDLSGFDTVVLVQPVWASGVCPPLRTWLRAHSAELSGKKLGFLVTAKGTPGEVLKAKFEEEFGSLAAFGAVLETQAEEVKAGVLSDLAKALGL